jgi:hypothetical protein
MKISERIKSLFWRELPTAGEVAARADADGVRDQIRENEAVLNPNNDPRLGGGELPTSLTPPPF